MQLPVQKTLACKEKKVVYSLHDSIDSVTFIEWLEWKFIIALSESAAFFYFQEKKMTLKLVRKLSRCLLLYEIIIMKLKLLDGFYT